MSTFIERMTFRFIQNNNYINLYIIYLIIIYAIFMRVNTTQNARIKHWFFCRKCWPICKYSFLFLYHTLPNKAIWLGQAKIHWKFHSWSRWQKVSRLNNQVFNKDEKTSHRNSYVRIISPSLLYMWCLRLHVIWPKKARKPGIWNMLVSQIATFQIQVCLWSLAATVGKSTILFRKSNILSLVSPLITTGQIFWISDYTRIFSKATQLASLKP